MKKKILASLLTVSVILSFTMPVFAAETVMAKPTSSTVLVNDQNVAFEAYNINGNNYFKLRDIACTLSGTAKQFEIGWDGANNAITLTSGKSYTTVGGEMTSKGAGDKSATPTSSKIYLDGTEVNFTAYNIEGNNYFKLRDIGKAFNFAVVWDGESNTITINTSNGYEEVLKQQDYSILDNRLHIKMPEGTVDSAYQSSIMSAPVSNHEETRLIFDNNEETLIVYAYERFRYSSGSIADDAELLADIWGKSDGSEYTFSDITHIGNAEMIVITQVDFDASQEAIFLKSALVKMPDNMLINVSVYANQKMFANRQYCLDFAESLLHTLSMGTRIVDTSKHKESIWLHEIELQKDYIITLNRGADFDVYYISKITTFGAAPQSVMGIYIGGHPSASGPPENDEVSKATDNILGQTIEWALYKQDDMTRMETVFKIPSSDYLMMHIFISAYDEVALEEFRTMAHSLKSSD